MRRVPRLQELPTLRRVVLGALIGVVVGLLLLPLRRTPLFETVELKFIDVRTEQFLGERPPDPRIVLAEIEEDDVRAVLAAWGEKWPWPLELNAAAVGVMDEAGVAALVVDMFHLDRGAGLDDVPHQEGVDLTPLEPTFLYEAEQGEVLGRALARLGRATLAFELAPQAQYEVPPRVRAAEARLGGDLLAGAPRGIVHGGANLPVRRVAEGAYRLGFANVKPDLDGVVRRGPTVGRWGERPVPSLALAAADVVTGGRVRFEAGAVVVGDVRQPLMEDGSFLVDFRGYPRRTYRRVPPSQLLQWGAVQRETGTLPPEATKQLSGAIVVWGLNVAGHEDIVTTPLSGEFHGPEYQAAVLDNLLNGGGRVRAAPWLDLLVLFGLTVLIGGLEGAIRSRWLPHLVPLLLGLVLLVGAFALFRHGTSIDLFTPLVGVGMTWVATAIVRVLTEGRRNRWLEGTFGLYLAPSIIEALKRDPSLLALGGRRRDITILFSDVANFTKLSEALRPDQVVQLLNRYLTAHSAAVMEEGGVVDKFMGDGVMAFFGDPIPTADHAYRACRAALAVAERVPALRPVWEAMGLTSFHARIGVNTGTAVVGNMGSEQRFSYTCMGDAVNLASRLEGANKSFGSTILIGSRTQAEAGALVLARPIGDLVVVGRAQAEPVYELLALADSAPPDVRALVEAYTRGHEALRRGDLAGAGAALEEAERVRPGDGPTAWLRAVLARVAAGEEPAPWSGRVTLTGK